MTAEARRSPFPRPLGALVLAALCTWAAESRAESPEPSPAIAEDLGASVAAVASAFGPDAVLMQAYLLHQAVRSGSVLEATIHRPVLETREGRRFLSFALDSGIVFNDQVATPEARMVRVWSDLVEPVLQRYRDLDLPADGVAFDIRYHHRAYADESELRALIPREGRGQPERATFFLLLEDLRGLLRKELTSQELLNRSLVLRDGQRYALRLPPAP